MLIGGFVVLMMAGLFTGCPEPENNSSTTPTHTHDWGDWGATTLEGTEQRTCKSDPAHIEHRLTGTERFTFTANTATAYSVTKGDVTSGDVVIPAYYRPDNSGDHLTGRGYLPVTAIGSNAFYQCLHIKSINIPETITTIGNNAFSYCDLDSLIIPASVTSIGSGAFSYCYIDSITIPSSVTSIGSGAFSYCSIDSITIPSSVTEVGSGAFSYWDEWQIINVPFDDEKAADDAWGAGWRNGCDAIIIGKIAHNGTLGLVFELIDNGTAYSVSAGKAKSGEVRIPASYNGKPVTEISNNAFAGCTGLTGINIPTSVTTISDSAFTGCTGLTGITIPASVTSIGSGAFAGCTGLTGVTIPASVTSLSGDAFAGCTGLTGITVASNNLDYSSEGGIVYSKEKTQIICVPQGISGNVTIPASVTSIGSGAFAGCTGLTGVTIPASVTSIGQYAFNGCTGLTGITVAANNSNYSSEGGILYNKAKTEIIVVPKGISGNVTIPASVTSINRAFNGTGLTSITIPASVTSIDYAFENCTGLTSITIPASVTSIQGTFNGCTSLTSITIPVSVTSIGYNAFNGCTGLTSITIPASVTTIRNGAFSGCTSLRNIIIDNDAVENNPPPPWDHSYQDFNWGDRFPATNLSVTFKRNIGGNAFSGCTRLVSVTISEGVTTIGGSAFSGCTGLTGITIPEGVTSIGGGAFGGCTGLTGISVASNNSNYSSEGGIVYNKAKTEIILVPKGISGNITIPASVTSIGEEAFSERAFSNCTGLTGITIPASVTTISYYAFAGCTGLTSISVDANNPNYAAEGGILYNNTKTMIIAIPSARGSVTIPASVTSIGNQAFYGCTGLTGITIPNSVTYIGYGTFSGCTGLTSVTIPNSVTYIGYGTFSGCTGLTSVTIPNNITFIVSGMFSGCTSLTSLTIPVSVTSIGSQAFYGCTGLTSITIPASVTSIGYSIGYSAFSGWTASQTINIQGKANREATISAGWSDNWDDNCNAQINYLGQ